MTAVIHFRVQRRQLFIEEIGVRGHANRLRSDLFTPFLENQLGCFRAGLDSEPRNQSTHDDQCRQGQDREALARADPQRNRGGVALAGEEQEIDANHRT